MVCDTGGINDQSFNQSSWEGLQEFAESEGAKVNYLESTQASDFATNFDKLSDEDLNLIWGIGIKPMRSWIMILGRRPRIMWFALPSMCRIPLS